MARVIPPSMRMLLGVISRVILLMWKIPYAIRPENAPAVL